MILLALRLVLFPRAAGCISEARCFGTDSFSTAMSLAASKPTMRAV